MSRLKLPTLLILKCKTEWQKMDTDLVTNSTSMFCWMRFVPPINNVVFLELDGHFAVFALVRVHHYLLCQKIVMLTEWNTRSLNYLRLQIRFASLTAFNFHSTILGIQRIVVQVHHAG